MKKARLLIIESGSSPAYSVWFYDGLYIKGYETILGKLQKSNDENTGFVITLAEPEILANKRLYLTKEKFQETTFLIEEAVAEDCTE